MDDIAWPAGFYDIGDRSFKWVFDNRKEFVDFTLTEMEVPSGLFLKWQDYCKQQIINDKATGQPIEE